MRSFPFNVEMARDLLMTGSDTRGAVELRHVVPQLGCICPTLYTLYFFNQHFYFTMCIKKKKGKKGKKFVIVYVCVCFCNTFKNDSF